MSNDAPAPCTGCGVSDLHCRNAYRNHGARCCVGCNHDDEKG